MKKILSILASTVILAAPATVIACGGETPSFTPGGEQNITAAFTLSKSVNVKSTISTQKDLTQAIFAEAVNEQRMDSHITFNMGIISDSENLQLPPQPFNPVDGFLVFTITDANAPYRGSVTINFTLVLQKTVDVTQQIDVNTLLDVTPDTTMPQLQLAIWNQAVDQFAPNTPTDINKYIVLQTPVLPVKGDYNKEIPVQLVMQAKDEFLSGEITINTNMISYHADGPEMEVEISSLNISEVDLHQAIWDKVNQFPAFQGDVAVSSDFEDYAIDWSSVQIPDKVGTATTFSFLATPNDVSLYHYIYVEGSIIVAPVVMPSDIYIPEPILVRESDNKKIDNKKIWDLAMKNSGLTDIPSSSLFDISTWSDKIAKNWPPVESQKSIVLSAVNRNSNGAIKGDINIHLVLMNDGLYQNINLDPILLNSSTASDSKKALEEVWTKITNKFVADQDTNIDAYEIDLDSFNSAYKQASERHIWTTYTINGNLKEDATFAHDVTLSVVGQLNIIDQPLTDDVTIDETSLTLNYTNNNHSDPQAAFLSQQLWADVITSSEFSQRNGKLYGLSQQKVDWSSFSDQISIAIQQHVQSDFNLDLTLHLLDQTLYSGQLTIKIKLTFTNQIDLGTIDLSSTPVNFATDYIPAKDDEYNNNRLIATIMEYVWKEAIYQNKDFQANYPDLSTDSKNYNWLTAEIIDQFTLPTVDNIGTNPLVLTISGIHPLNDYYITADITIQVSLTFNKS